MRQLFKINENLSNGFNATMIFRYFLYCRCTDIGKYQLLGSNSRTCIHSEWTGLKPVCNGLNQENDYASEF